MIDTKPLHAPGIGVENFDLIVIGPLQNFAPHRNAARQGDEETAELLGVFIMAANATELISETALAKLLESTPWEIGASIHPHPPVSESVKEAALAVDGQAIHI